MSRLEIALLGPFQVTLDGEPVTRFGADTARALLAYLAMHPGLAHRREVLAGLLWPERPDPEALRNLRVALSRLRDAIGDREAHPPHLLVTRQTIQLDPDGDWWLDVRAFRDALAEVRAHHHHRRLEECDVCAGRLGEAIDLYRGEFLAGFALDSAPFEEWLVVEREGLHGQALEALGALATYHAVQEAYDEALACARRAVELEPWREEAHRGAMRALALSGQRGAALAQYETCRAVLDEELGVAPEAETVALYGRIREGEELLPPAAPVPHNLPARLTPFVGRGELLNEIEGRVLDDACRLLTLVGPGGSGKTRLALEVGRSLIGGSGAERFSDGVFFAPLAPVGSVEGIVPAVAQAVGLSFYGEGEPKQQLLGCLRRKRLLLVLDNYEHLLDGVGLVTDLLRAAAEVNVLVTSRAGLRVASEELCPVSGMDYPDLGAAIASVAEHGAVALFLQSARRMQPGFRLTEDNAADVARVCHLVRGMPLGILLAASWVKMLRPGEIAEQITHSLDFLEADWRDVPARQRSMRAVFDHSWRLLSEREQAVLAAFSAFRGGCTREAAQAVTGASLRELMSLVNRSLIQRIGDGRYEVHELLRQYAAEKLAETPDDEEIVHDRHCAHYVAALERWAADLRGERQQVAIAEMETDLANARASWDRAVEHGQAGRVYRAMDGLFLFYTYQQRQVEGEETCRATVEGLEASPTGEGLRALSRALSWRVLLNDGVLPVERLTEMAHRALDVLDDPRLRGLDTRPERAFATRVLEKGTFDNDLAEALRTNRRSVTLYRELGDRWGIAVALEKVGWAAYWLGDVDQAETSFRGSLALYRAQGDPRGSASALKGLFLVAKDTEDNEHLTRESIVLCEQIGDRVNAMHLRGLELVQQGRYAEARTLREELGALCADLGARWMATNNLINLVEISGHLGRYAEARAHAQDLYDESQRTGRTLDLGVCCHWLGCLDLAEGKTAQAQQWLQEALTICRQVGVQGYESLALLAYVEHRLGRSARARGALRGTLQAAIEQSLARPLSLSLPTIACVLTDEGLVGRAIELYALVVREPSRANSRWFEDVFGVHIAAAAKVLPPEVVAGAEERGRARDLWETADELLAELADS